MHDSPDLVIHRTEIWAVWRPQVGRKQLLVFLGAAVQHVRGAVCWCTVLLEHKVVIRHSAYRWQQYDVNMTSWNSIEEVSKRYHQNFLLCNNNEIIACIADLFNSLCEKVYTVAFFKVVQQQTTGEVGYTIMCLWADNFCLQQWKNYYNNLAIANRSLDSSAHNTLRAYRPKYYTTRDVSRNALYKCTILTFYLLTPWPWNLG